MRNKRLATNATKLHRKDELIEAAYHGLPITAVIQGAP